MNSEATHSANFYDVLAWLEVNKKKLIIATGSVVVIGFAAYAYNLQVSQKDLKADEALFKALASSVTGEDTTASPNAAAFLKVAADFPNTSAGERASALGASALFGENKYAEAQTQFEKFQREYSSSSLGPSAAFGVAACLDAQNKTNEAMKAYQNVLSRYPNEPVAPQAKLAIARLHEAQNQPELALKIYEELNRPNSQSAWMSEASTRREQLMAKYPQLAAVTAQPSPISVTTNAAGQRITLTPLPKTNAAASTTTTNAAVATKKTNSAPTITPVKK